MSISVKGLVGGAIASEHSHVASICPFRAILSLNVGFRAIRYKRAWRRGIFFSLVFFSQ
ncbi:MAG: hypothetical protein FWD77_00745 [Betaproteobacteria bacterium]|nr:hypothetical protein [Betaproteobacteria bacterium]